MPIDPVVRAEHLRAFVIARDASREPGLDPDERRRRERAALRLRNIVVTENMGLVKRVAKMSVGRGIELDDLKQYGAIGLIRALDTVDPTRSALGHYGTIWISQVISRAIDNERSAIRLPVHLAQNVKILARARHKLAGRLGREPTADEITDATGLSAEKIARVDGAKATAACRASIDVVVGDGATTLGDLMSDPNVVGADEAVSTAETARAVAAALDTLSPRAAEVIRLRYGFAGGREGDGLTLLEVGARAGVTRERIRQIEAKALRKLREGNRGASLRRAIGRDEATGAGAEG